MDFSISYQSVLVSSPLFSGKDGACRRFLKKRNSPVMRQKPHRSHAATLSSRYSWCTPPSAGFFLRRKEEESLRLSAFQPRPNRRRVSVWLQTIA